MLAAAVAARDLPRTMAMSSSTWQGALIFGPFIGGLLQAAGNVVPYLFAAAIDFVGVILVLGVSREVGTAHRESVSGPPTMRDATAGLRLIFATPALLGAISLDLVAVLFGLATLSYTRHPEGFLDFLGGRTQAAIGRYQARRASTGNRPPAVGDPAPAVGGIR